MQKFLADGVDVNIIIYGEGYGATPLMYASAMGNLEMVQCLVENGADVNAKNDGSGSTALMLASDAGHTEIVEYLKSKGAKE